MSRCARCSTRALCGSVLNPHAFRRSSIKKKVGAVARNVVSAVQTKMKEEEEQQVRG